VLKVVGLRGISSTLTFCSQPQLIEPLATKPGAKG
jgi:hypothetical protein